jgi:hypothetical protein
MNATTQAAPPRRSRRRRWLLGILLTVAAGVGIAIYLELQSRSQARTELDAIVADLDKKEGRWRLDDIEADRQQVPADKNAADVVLAAHKLMPANWQSALEDELEKALPNTRLHQEQMDRLLVDLRPLDAALRKARELKDYSAGRFKIRYAPDFIGTLVTEQQKVRGVAHLLDLDVHLQLCVGATDRACDSQRALMNAGKALGDEPVMVTTFVRIAADTMSVRSLERIIAHGELKGPQLLERQQALEEELNVPLLWTCLRGERAGIHGFLHRIETSDLPFSQAVAGLSGATPAPPGWWDKVSDQFAVSMVLHSHVTLLRFHTRAIEAAKLPAAKRDAAFKEMEADLRIQDGNRDRRQTLALMLLPAFSKVAQAEQRTQSLLACAVAGLAAERFRLQERRWPNTLDELVGAGLLKEVPIDRYDGKPLRLRRTTNGLAIFSIGPDGKYAGKGLDDDADPNPPNPPAFRVEFRLWDVGQRAKGN